MDQAHLARVFPDTIDLRLQKFTAVRAYLLDESRNQTLRIDGVSCPGEVQGAAVELASRFATGPASLRIAKRVMLEGYHLTLEEAAGVEAEGFADAFETEDQTVGVASFIENGPGNATFSGR